jgi:integrase
MNIQAEFPEVLTPIQGHVLPDNATRLVVRRKRKKKPVPEYLTEEEISRLFAAIGKDVRSQAIFQVVYYRGLRASEVGMLRLEDYRPAVGRLFVRRLKGSNSGDFHITATENTALKRWLRERGKDPGPLFPSRNGHPLSRWPINELMTRYCLAAGIPPVKSHPHALKHSCGTHLSARETDIVAIQDHLGHVNVQNTMIYIQMTSKRRDKFAESLENEGWGSNR